MKIFTILRNISTKVKFLMTGMARGTLTESNLNNVLEAGNYWVNPSTTTTNMPTSQYGTLEVVRTSTSLTGSKMQRFTQNNSSNMWERNYSNSQWNSWRYVGGTNISYNEFQSTSASRAANNSGSVSITITVPTGYSILAVVNAWSNGGVVPCYCTGGSASPATVWWRNTTSSAITCSFKVGVLFIRNS